MSPDMNFNDKSRISLEYKHITIGRMNETIRYIHEFCDKFLKLYSFIVTIEKKSYSHRFYYSTSGENEEEFKQLMQSELRLEHTLKFLEELLTFLERLIENVIEKRDITNIEEHLREFEALSIKLSKIGKDIEEESSHIDWMIKTYNRYLEILKKEMRLDRYRYYEKILKEYGII